MSDPQDILTKTNRCLRHTIEVFSKLRDLGWQDGHAMPRTGEKFLVVDFVMLENESILAYFKGRFKNNYYELLDDDESLVQKSRRPPMFWMRIGSSSD